MVLVRDFIDGEYAVSYEDGLKCKNAILQEIEKENIPVELNFEGVYFVITVFLNPIIGDLILERGPEVISYIDIKNADENIIKKIKMVRDGALLKRGDSEDGIF